MVDKLIKREEKAPATPERVTRMFAPACDVYENADEYLITAEMPGVHKEQVDVRLDRSRLTIQAERSSPSSVPTGGQRMYSRAFEIPDTVEAGRISASLRDGILSVRLPKAPQARVRQISVSSGG